MNCFRKFVLITIGILAAMTLGAVSPPLLKSLAEEGGAGAEAQKIEIISDTMMVDNKGNFAEFFGNVKAVQSGTVVTGNRLRVYFKEGAATDAGLIPGENSLTKLVVSGNVEIRFENKLALAQEAVYTTDNKVLVLTGENARIISDKNVVTGQKIIFYRTDGRIMVEGGGQKRVEAVFFPEGEGIQ